MYFNGQRILLDNLNFIILTNFIISLLKCEQFFGAAELENGFEKANILEHICQKLFCLTLLKGIKRQNKGPKEHDEKYIPSCGSK